MSYGRAKQSPLPDRQSALSRQAICATQGATGGLPERRPLAASRPVWVSFMVVRKRNDPCLSARECAACSESGPSRRVGFTRSHQLHITKENLLTLVDLSAIKRARRDLSLSEERYRTLLRAITAILWTADRDGRFASSQSEWEAYTGQSWNEHRGHGWLQAVHEDDRAHIRNDWQEAVAKGRLFEASGRLYSKTHGEHRYFIARAAPLLDEHGGIREWVGHVVDVHDAKMGELSSPGRKPSFGASSTTRPPSSGSRTRAAGTWLLGGAARP